MIVVSDTSAMTALLQIGRCLLLPELFSDVFVPPAVQTELLRFHDRLPGFVRVRRPAQSHKVNDFLTQLDRGEAEAIALALELRADYLLIDEKRGRNLAEREGLKVMGLLGVLLLGRKRGVLDSVRDAMDELESKAGFYVGSEVREAVLRAAGET